jgi:hypothetical protein
VLPSSLCRLSPSHFSGVSNTWPPGKLLAAGGETSGKARGSKNAMQWSSDEDYENGADNDEAHQHVVVVDDDVMVDEHQESRVDVGLLETPRCVCVCVCVLMGLF